MDVAVVGSGVGGLAAAMQLGHAGLAVEVFERHAQPGGKMRTLETPIGPVDAGPTVLTMLPVIRKAFADAGETLEDHVKLLPQDKLARHYWPDGTALDLFADADRNFESIRDVFGGRSAAEFRAFEQKSRMLFDAFQTPIMYARKPDLMRLVGHVFARPRLLSAMMPHKTLARALSDSFFNPKLAQLFGRYATYVGGSPFSSPSLLGLIWQAEAGGVWQVEGGMHALAVAMQRVAEKKGVRFRFNTDISDILAVDDTVQAITLPDGQIHKTQSVVFNGDPAALSGGLLGKGASDCIRTNAIRPRSHSANVWSFAAETTRDDLELHNVFFSDDRAQEFTDLAHNKMPTAPTLYVYAQDRGGAQRPSGPERFEIIMNAPPTTSAKSTREEIDRCRTLTFSTLERMGLSFSEGPKSLTTPTMFADLFPASQGALYGRSPHGMMSAFKRPTARTPIKGLYLAGGGCHPGAGVPMATLSGCHAAEAILSDQTSTSKSRRTVTRGGMSMASPTMARGPSR